MKWWFLTLGLSVAAWANPLSESVILKSYNLEAVDSGVIVLRAILDSSSNPPLKLCGLDSAQAQRLMRPLKPLWDIKVSTFSKSKLSTRDWGRCAAGCHCGIYQDILKRLGAEYERKDVSSLAASVSQGDLEVCAKKAEWFCRSRLLKYLKLKASEFEAEGGL